MTGKQKICLLLFVIVAGFWCFKALDILADSVLTYYASSDPTTNSLDFRPRVSELSADINLLQIDVDILSHVDAEKIRQGVVDSLGKQYAPSRIFGNRILFDIEVLPNLTAGYDEAEFISDDSNAVVNYSNIEPNFKPEDPLYLFIDPIDGYSLYVHLFVIDKKETEESLAALMLWVIRSYLPQAYDRGWYFPELYEKIEPPPNGQRLLWSVR